MNFKTWMEVAIAKDLSRFLPAFFISNFKWYVLNYFYWFYFLALLRLPRTPLFTKLLTSSHSSDRKKKETLFRDQRDHIAIATEFILASLFIVSNADKKSSYLFKTLFFLWTARAITWRGVSFSSGYVVECKRKLLHWSMTGGLGFFYLICLGSCCYRYKQLTEAFIGLAPL